jgi:hypothetical protein
MNMNEQDQDYQEWGVDLNNELSYDEIISFLRDNEMTDKEIDWLRSQGTFSGLEVLKLTGQILLNRFSNWIGSLKSS